MPVPVFDCDPIYVAAAASATRRINNDFEFMKVEVRVELPCVPNPDDIRETLGYATGLIDELMNGAGEDLGVPALAEAAEPARPYQPGTPIA